MLKEGAGALQALGDIAGRQVFKTSINRSINECYAL